jgi:hypothetical protein
MRLACVGAIVIGIYQVMVFSAEPERQAEEVLYSALTRTGRIVEVHQYKIDKVNLDKNNHEYRDKLVVVTLSLRAAGNANSIENRQVVWWKTFFFDGTTPRGESVVEIVDFGNKGLWLVWGNSLYPGIALFSIDVNAKPPGVPIEFSKSTPTAISEYVAARNPDAVLPKEFWGLEAKDNLGLDDLRAIEVNGKLLVIARLRNGKLKSFIFEIASKTWSVVKLSE